MLMAVLVLVQVVGTQGIAVVNAKTGVTELESVIVSGGVFDTGICIDENYKVEMVFTLSTLSQYKDIYYAAKDNSYAYRLRNENVSGFLVQYGWHKTKNVYKPQVNQDIVAIQDRKITYINGVQVQKASKNQDLATTKTLKFGDLVGSIKGFKIWNASNVLVADYIPVLDFNQKACMYNKVNGEFCYYSKTCVAGNKKAIIEEPESSEHKIESETESAESNIEQETEVVENKTETETESAESSIEQKTEVVENKTETETESAESNIKQETEVVENKTETTTEKVESYAETVESSTEIKIEEVTNKVYDSPAVEVKKTIEDELYDMYITGDMGKRDVSSYKVTYSEFYGMWPKFKEKNYALCANGYNTYPDAEYSGNYVTKIKIVNMDSNFAQRYQKSLLAINEFMAGVDNKMTDLDKIVWAHEFLVKHITYKDTGKIAHTSGGALGDAQCVCDGYVNGMITLLNLVGVESKKVFSNDMNHSWSYVKLDGQWYHMDTTWDDTRKGGNEVYAHRYLLRNDNEFNAMSHYKWSGAGTASVSTKYTNWFVHDVAGSMYYSNGLWYY